MLAADRGVLVEPGADPIEAAVGALRVAEAGLELGLDPGQADADVGPVADSVETPAEALEVGEGQLDVPAGGLVR